MESTRTIGKIFNESTPFFIAAGLKVRFPETPVTLQTPFSCASRSLVVFTVKVRNPPILPDWAAENWQQGHTVGLDLLPF
jgi:hypothetical protein